MYNFASLTLVELAPILSIYAGMLAGFYAIVKFIISNGQKNSDGDREERQNVLKDLTASMNRMAEASERAAREAEQRNGHLAEISNQNRDIIIKAVANIKEQHVDRQTVDKSIVRRKR